MILCEHCQGGGRRPLGDALFRCLSAIALLGRPSIPEIARSLKEDVHPTAINRRVKTLVKLKLVKAQRNGGGVYRYGVMPGKAERA